MSWKAKKSDLSSEEMVRRAGPMSRERYGDLGWDQGRHIGIETDESIGSKVRLARGQVLLSVYQTPVALEMTTSLITSTLKVFLHVTYTLLDTYLFRDSP